MAEIPAFPGPRPLPRAAPPAPRARRRAPGIAWRQIEIAGVALALLIHSGALFPLLLAPDGIITAAARSKLQMLSLLAQAIGFGLLLRHPGRALAALKREPVLLLLMLLPFLSVLWSISPSTTLRRAVGLMGSMFLAYLLGTRFTARQLLVLVAALLGAMMLASLLLLGAAPGLARMPEAGELRGIFLNKNVMGWYASLCLLTAAALLRDPERRLRRLGLGVAPPAVACLLASGSFTALLAAVTGALLLWFHIALPRLGPKRRLLLTLLVLELSVLLLLAAEAWMVPLLEEFGRDPTFTGRVPLWQEADARIATHLGTGYGYGAFWTPGNVEAWKIWAAIGWEAPHAHNGYRDILLGLGAPGLGVLALAVARGMWRGAVLQLREPQAGWLWLNVLMGVGLVMNLSESWLMQQNETLWILYATALVMTAYRMPRTHAAAAQPANPGTPPYRMG